MSTLSASTARTDPFTEQREAHRAHFLHALNPLAKVAAPLPVMIALVVTRGITIPLSIALLCLVLLLIGAHLRPRMLALLFVGLPVLVLVMGVSFGVWIDPSRLEDGPALDIVLFQLGDYTFTLAAYLLGLATSVRIAALLMLALLAGLTSTGPDLVRAMVQNLRVPYRIGYTALAAFRFVPRFGRELEIIRAAHRVRGTNTGRGPVAALARLFGYAVPLLASAIRHAERVALAMDARAFGAHATRTERHVVRWRARDTVFVISFWLATIAIYWWAIATGNTA